MLVLRKSCLLHPAAGNFWCRGTAPKKEPSAHQHQAWRLNLDTPDASGSEMSRRGDRTCAAESVEPCHNVGKPNLRVRSHECKHDALTVPPLSGRFESVEMGTMLWYLSCGRLILRSPGVNHGEETGGGGGRQTVTQPSVQAVGTAGRPWIPAHERTLCGQPPRDPLYLHSFAWEPWNDELDISPATRISKVAKPPLPQWKATPRASVTQISFESSHNREAIWICLLRNSCEYSCLCKAGTLEAISTFQFRHGKLEKINTPFIRYFNLAGMSLVTTSVLQSH